MSRNVRVFRHNSQPSGIPDYHLSKSEALVREQRGVIVRRDVAGTEYLESGPLGLTSEQEQFKNILHPHISSKMIEDAVAGRGNQKKHALEKIEAYGARLVTVSELTFDRTDVWLKTNRGEPVVAFLRRRDEEVARQVADYLLLRFRTGKFSIRLENLSKLYEVKAQDQPSGFSVSGTVRRPTEVPTANRLLIDLWPKVVIQFFAREFSAPLNRMRPDQLPAGIVYHTLQTYSE